MVDAGGLRITSAERYLRHLRYLTEDDGLSSQSQAAVEHLVSTLAASLERRTSLSPADIRFDWRELELVPDLELQAFVNQFSLGVGTETAPVVFMGTEEAGDALDPQALGLHCLQAALWLADCPQPLLAIAADGQDWLERLNPPLSDPGRRRYDVHPNDYIHVEHLPGRGTWEVVSNALGCDLAEMGNRCYQIERSAFAATQSYRGLPPSDERVRFLVRAVMPALAQTAHSLVLHGRMDDEIWRRSDTAIASAFLGSAPEYHEEQLGERHIRWATATGRKVFFTRALSGQNVDGQYLDWLRNRLNS